MRVSVREFGCISYPSWVGPPLNNDLVQDELQVAVETGYRPQLLGGGADRVRKAASHLLEPYTQTLPCSSVPTPCGVMLSLLDDTAWFHKSLLCSKVGIGWFSDSFWVCVEDDNTTIFYL